MGAEYVPFYLDSRGNAERFGNTELWEKSFRENVACARSIEKAIRECSDEEYHILPGCAKSVLDEYGFKRTGFILAHSVHTLGPLVKASSEIEAWSQQQPYSRDGDYGRHYRADTALMNLEEFIGQYQAEFQKFGMFGMEHQDSSAWETSLVGKVLILSPNVLKEECLDPRNQLWYCVGGFGANPNASGRAVYGVCLSDGEEARWNRQDFLGVLDEQYLPDWATEKLQALRAPQQEQSGGPATGPVMQHFC